MKKYFSILFLLTSCIVFLCGCEHEHKFKDATCSQPRTCSICKTTEGEPLGHDYGDAKCDEQAVCLRCNEKSTDVSGHTTKIGVCDKCGKFQGEDRISDILSVATTANEHAYNYYFIVSAEDGTYEQCLAAVEAFGSLEEYYQDAYDNCGDYEIMAGMKKALGKVIETLPVTSYGNAASQIKIYIKDVNKFADNVEKLQKEMMKVQKYLK